jgi:hypothetical protein
MLGLLAALGALFLFYRTISWGYTADAVLSASRFFRGAALITLALVLLSWAAGNFVPSAWISPAILASLGFLSASFLLKIYRLFSKRNHV